MSLARLQEFVERKRKEAIKTKIDWEERKKEWLEAIDKLYQMIEDWLKELDIEITYEEIELFEEKLGSYKVKKMILDVGGEKVEVKPIGTFIIAAKGRVDIEGPKGKAKVVLVPKDSKGPMIKVQIFPSEIDFKREFEKENKKDKDKIIQSEWKIVTSPPEIKYIELNKDTFSEVLLGVLGADECFQEKC